MATVGIFDSGAGGLSVLREMMKVAPGAKYIYYSDNANCPYGDKSPEFIKDRCTKISRMLIEKGAQLIVVACNTATAAAISHLRSTFDIPFIGMEPAVKPAALGTKSGVIGVLATSGTLKGSLYLDTRGRYEDKVRIIEHVGRGFVELVENMELEGPHAENVVKASLDPLIETGADTIVLGCTHYPFLLPLMQKLTADSGIRFIDPAPAVARRMLEVLEGLNRKAMPSEDATLKVELLSSGPSDTLKKLFDQYM